MTDSQELTVIEAPVPTLANVPCAPKIILNAGAAACFAWEEFFAASIRNHHTRTAYALAVRRFFEWIAPSGLRIDEITPGMVGTYLSQHPGSVPTRKLHLAALRALFDLLVVRHVMILNPANSVRGERYEVVEGKTPEISIQQARELLGSIKTDNLVGLRDRAIIGVLIYTAARAGAVAKLQLRHFAFDGVQWTFRFEEKGGKSREIPVRHDLQQFILDYLAAAGVDELSRNVPLFRSAERRTGRLTANAMSNIDICRIVKRRLSDAGLPGIFSPHSFRVTTVTDLLTQGVPLEDVQHLAGHADPRTTRLYDRRQKRVSRNIVERISV
jgi:integrase/recombinase XerD